VVQRKDVFSMTGFGRASHEQGLEVEIRSVNHRYLDLALKLPRALGEWEDQIRKSVTTKLVRGRVEVLMTLRSGATTTGSMIFKEPVYRDMIRCYCENLHIKEPTPEVIFAVLGRREVLEVSEEQSLPDNFSLVVVETFENALQQLLIMRRAEGAHLAQEISERTERLVGYARQIASYATVGHAQLKQRMLDRIARLSPEVTLDPMRITAEVALISDRVDTSEEISRLDSHFSQARAILSAGGECGRKLDFLIQEVGREFNTIGSKSQDAAIQHCVVEAKAELEKMREQVQNVE
jgi:uncharacterized protein (TIGR00255 family)